MKIHQRNHSPRKAPATGNGIYPKDGETVTQMTAVGEYKIINGVPMDYKLVSISRRN